MNIDIVIPVLFTQVNWREWTRIYEYYMGDRPTKELDKEGIKLQDPAAWLASLDPLHKPQGAVGRNLQHGFCGFIMVLNQDEAIIISEHCVLNIKVFRFDEGESPTLLTGTLLNWREAILEFCSINYSKNLRIRFNKVVKHFDKTHLKHIFNKYKKQNLPDGTFVYGH